MWPGGGGGKRLFGGGVVQMRLGAEWTRIQMWCGKCVGGGAPREAPPLP